MNYKLEFSPEALTEIQKLKKSGNNAVINKSSKIIFMTITKISQKQRFLATFVSALR
jgi:mRNA-degrading endonuclease RelE of RelBE toxin-antitoxin system